MIAENRVLKRFNELSSGVLPLKVKPPGREKIVRSRSENGQLRELASVGLALKNRRDQAAKPTIIDVARLASVSPATVSNALNGRPNVDAKTRDRVLAAVRKLGYTPNLRARRLRTGRADTIAIFSSMS